MALCRILKIDRGDLYAVETGKAGPVRGERVLSAIGRGHARRELGIKGLRKRLEMQA